MGWASHNIDRIEEFTSERRVAEGWDELAAQDFDTHPMTNEEWDRAYERLTSPAED